MCLKSNLCNLNMSSWIPHSLIDRNCICGILNGREKRQDFKCLWFLLKDFFLNSVTKFIMLEHVTIRWRSLLLQSGLCQTVVPAFLVHDTHDLDGVPVPKKCTSCQQVFQSYTAEELKSLNFLSSWQKEA